MSTPLVNPTPSHIVGDDHPPPVPRRQPGTSYQPSLPTSMYGYGANPYGMNQNFGYGGFMPGFANPMMLGNTLPSDSMFHGVESLGRGAFESVGSVVQTLSSVSMMLQSTLFAIQNSVQAIGAVADQFNHLRNHLLETSISIVQLMKYYFRKLLHLFHIDRRAVVDKIWDEATHKTRSSHDRRGILLFFAIVIGTPYVMWRLLKSIISHGEYVSNWKKGIGEHFVAEAKFTYKAINNDELSITCGEMIRIAPKHKQPRIKGWILASKDEKYGLVPANYIKILSKNNNIENNPVKEEEDENGKLTDISSSTIPDDNKIN